MTPKTGTIGWTDRCVELGGKVLTGPTGAEGKDRTCVIQDPAGAVMALYQPAG